MRQNSSYHDINQESPTMAIRDAEKDILGSGQAVFNTPWSGLPRMGLSKELYVSSQKWTKLVRLQKRQ